MIDIPGNYFSNLSSYEEFCIKCALIGEEPSSAAVLEKIYRSGDYFWFVANGNICFIDNNGNKVDVNEIKSDMLCCSAGLASLNGFPAKIKRNFDCSYNNLESLEGCPRTVFGYFNCSNNMLNNLDHCPRRITGSFMCDYNNLTSLKGCPTKINGAFYCNNNKLESLEGCPARIGRIFICSDNPLRTLRGAPSKVGKLWIEGCDRLSKKQISDYMKFLDHPIPDLMDETGHYLPKD